MTGVTLLRYVRYWHRATSVFALHMSAIGGKADIHGKARKQFP